MTRHLNAQFLAVMAAQAAATSKVTPSLEAADPAGDPTEGNAPDTTEHDKAEEAAHAAHAAAAPADAAAAPVADPAAAPTADAPAATDAPADAATPPAADPAADDAAPADAAAGDTPVEPAAAVTDPIGADLTAAGATDPVNDPADTPVDGATDPAGDPAAATDPVADTVAGADAGTPPADAMTADAGQGSEPQKIVIDVNVNVNGGGDDAAAAAPIDDAAAAVVEPTDGVVAEDPVVAPDAAVNPAAADAPVDPAASDAAVVATEPVTSPVGDAAANPVIDETSGVDTTMVDANILSEEELKVMMPSTEDVDGVKVVDETAVEIEVLEGEIGQYEAGHTAMKSMTEVLDTAAENGGTDESGAKILKIAIEHICDQLQLPQSTLGIPSMESFKSPGSARVSATTLAMEDLKETTAKIWAAIQAGWAKIMEWLGNFFKHILDGNQRLATRAQQIQTSVKSVGDQVLNETFDNPNIAKKLAAGQKVSPQIPQSLVALNKFAAGCASSAPELLQQMTAACTKADQLGRDPNATDQQWGEARVLVRDLSRKFIQALTPVSGMKPAGNGGATFGLGAAPEGTELMLSSTWLGNKVVYAYVPEDGPVGFRAGQATADVGEISGTVPVLPPKTIGDIAYLVLEYTKVAASAQTYWQGLQQVYKTVMAVGAALGAADKTANSEKIKMMTSMLKEVRSICSGIQQPALAVAAAANNAALDYAAISLKTLGAKAAGEVAAAKAKATPAAPAAAAPAAPAAAPAAA